MARVVRDSSDCRADRRGTASWIATAFDAAMGARIEAVIASSL
jgi:hypothetical protein